MKSPPKPSSAKPHAVRPAAAKPVAASAAEARPVIAPPSPASAASLGRVVLGYVARAHGIRGALRVRPASGLAEDTARSLSRAKTLYLDDVARELTRVRPERDDLLIELAGLTDRGEAEALRGRTLYVDRDDLPPPDEDQVYLADLVGCEVSRPDGRAIGRIRGSYDSGAQDVLIVDAQRGEVLLPFVEPMLIEVDLEARRVIYDPPPGLLGDED